jgi:predicted dehydrogenase
MDNNNVSVKIGLIGAQNSHSRHFCDVLNHDRKYPGYAITRLYGADDPAEAGRLCTEFGLTESASEEDVIEKCDAIVITYRKGSQHYAAAMKALRAGKPLFNDKPFSTSLKETKEIVDYAGAHNVLLTGGSSVKSLPGLSKAAAAIRPGSNVIITFAADPDSEYDGYWFYGIHAVELCIQLCGESFTSVSAIRNGNMVVSVVNYADRQCVIATSPNSPELKIVVTNNGQTETFHVPLNYQSVCPDEFAEMLKAKKPPRAYSHYEKATELLAGIIGSLGL